MNMLGRWRVKRLSLDPEFLGTLFTLNTRIVIESKLPIDAKVESVDKDTYNNRLGIIYSSKEFEPINEGEPVPELPYDTVTIIDEGMDDR